MILSNLELDGTLALAVAGETKAVTMLTDTSTVPYLAYYTMPSGFAEWLTVTVSGNVFQCTAVNNLFGESARSVVVAFKCLPTAGGTLQTTNVTVTQAADTVSVTFDPTGVSFAYTEGATGSAAVAGVPTGANVEVSAPDWLDASMSGATALSLIADLNEAEVARTGSVAVLVDSRPFYLPVTQAANTAALTFDPTAVSLAYTAGAPDDVTITGLPSGEAVTIVTPEWLTATLASSTLTVTALVNESLSARSGNVEITVVGRTFYLAVTQAANAYQYGPLTLNESSHTAAWTGATWTASATAMPTNATVLDCTAKEAGSCATCGDTENKVSITRLTDTSFSITVVPQDVFDGVERSFVLHFTAGNESADLIVTQSAPPAVHRLYGTGDKFIKNVTSSSAPTYIVAAAVQTIFGDLKSSGWVVRNSLSASKLVGAQRTEIELKAGAFDAFKVYHDREELEGEVFQHVSMGAAVYRFTFSAASYGLTLRGIRVNLRTDAYCTKGLRVALQTTNETDAPSNDWAVIREGTGGFFKASCYPRTVNPNDNLYYGADGAVVFDGLSMIIDADSRLYLYVTMEDYTGLTNGWVYGSGIVAPLFDFYVDDLITGVEDLDSIAQTTIEKDAYPLVSAAVVLSPEAPAQTGAEEREVAVRDVVFGSSPSKLVPAPADATTAVAFLNARLAASGMSPLDLSQTPLQTWQKNQLGMTCSVTRQIIGASSPFSQRLLCVCSPLAVLCALPVSYFPTVLRLTHRTTQPTVVISGANIKLSVYWVKNKAVSLKQVSSFFALPGFSSGAITLTVGGISAGLIGSVDLPASIVAGSELAVRIKPLDGRWGTLLLVPWIYRVTATSLFVDEPIGLVGVAVGENEVLGTGWVPDVQLEM